MPVLVAGLITCVLLEQVKIFDYGAQLPERVREILMEFDAHEASIRTAQDNARLVVQAVAALFLVFALAFMSLR